MSNNSIESPLISAEELVNLMPQPQVKIFDVRGRWNGDPAEASKAYTQSHIEGAVFLDWTSYFVEPDTLLNLASVANEAVAN